LVALLVTVAAGVRVIRNPRAPDGPFLPDGAAGAPATGRAIRFEDMTGRMAPEFRLTDLNGTQHSLHALRGQVVMLVFWATWCKTCPRELPHLSEIAHALAPQGLVTLSVNGEQDAGPVVEMTRGLSFPVLRDPEDRVRQAYEAFAVPRVVIVDRAGRIARIIRGYQGETTPITGALAEQGLSLPAGATQVRAVPVERVGGGPTKAN